LDRPDVPDRRLCPHGRDRQTTRERDYDWNLTGHDTQLSVARSARNMNEPGKGRLHARLLFGERVKNRMVRLHFLFSARVRTIRTRSILLQLNDETGPFRKDFPLFSCAWVSN